MAKKTFFVCTVKNEVEDRFSYAFEERNGYNLSYFCRPMSEGEVEYLCVCNTKADAIATAKDWNLTWEARGHLWNGAPMYYRAIF